MKLQNFSHYFILNLKKNYEDPTWEADGIYIITQQHKFSYYYGVYLEN